MTKNILKQVICIISTISICSCEKINFDDHVVTIDKNGHKVNFVVDCYNVTNFNENNSSRATAKELGTILNFAIFKDGQKISTVNQKKEDNNFGSITASLNDGEYDIIALIHSNSGNATITSPNEVKFKDNKLSDTFYYYANINIDDNITHNITLERCVAKYQFTITSTIPENVKTMEFYYTGGSSTLDPTSGLGSVDSRQTETRNVTSNVSGQTFEVYTIPKGNDEKLKMKISAKDESGNVVKEMTFENVPIERNRITKHEYDFFAGIEPGASSNDISYTFEGDLEWGDDITINPL